MPPTGPDRLLGPQSSPSANTAAAAAAAEHPWHLEVGVGGEQNKAHRAPKNLPCLLTCEIQCDKTRKTRYSEMKSSIYPKYPFHIAIKHGTASHTVKHGTNRQSIDAYTCIYYATGPHTDL